MEPVQFVAGLVFTGAYCGVLCVAQKLGTLKMAIRTEADSQKAVAIDAGIDPSNLTRKLNGEERLSLHDLDKLPEEVQRAWHLEELARMGLPQRAKRWLVIARAVEGSQKRTA
jgi:hypothetical protein